jgi:glycosyltransferase involved in cell wall biosynthesis
MIHDLIPINFPEFSIPKEYKRHSKRITNTLRYSEKIITNSKYTKQALLKFSKIKKIKSKNKIIISHLPVNLFSKNKINYKLKKNYFVILGNIEPRKNHIFLFEIWKKLIKEKNPPYLYIVGRRGWECEQAIDYLDRSIDLKKYIIEINKADDDLLIKILKDAKALLTSSYTEGFGIIIHEALQFGTPVIASNLSVFKESAKNIPDYIDILDGKKWLNTIVDYNKKNSQLRSAQLKRIKKYQPISSEDHFKVIKNLFH